jgi:hypothetical protein
MRSLVSRCRLAGLLAALLMAPGAWGADAPANQVLNPGFELPNHASWVFQDKVKAAVDTDQPHEGQNSLRQEAVKGNRWNCVAMASGEIIKVEPGHVYPVSVWSRNNLVGGGASILVREMGDKKQTIRYVYHKIPAQQADWKQYQFIHKPSEKATGLQIYLYVAPTAASGAIWWDDVSMTQALPGDAPAAAPKATAAEKKAAPTEHRKMAAPVSEAPKGGNLAPDPGFELPDHPGWALQENVKAAVDASHPHQGQNSLRQDAVKGNRWNCVSMSSNDIVTVQPGEIYYVSVWSRNDLVGGSPSILIREIDAKKNTIHYEYHKLPANKTDWKQYDLTYRPSAKAVGLQIYLYIAPGAASGSVWWDDVSMTAVADPFPSNTSRGLQMAPLATSVIVLGKNGDARHPQSAAGAGETNNLALNPGFELPGLKDWTPLDQTRIVQDSDQRKDGQYSLRQDSDKGSNSNEVWMTPVKVQPGMLYHLSVQGRNTLVGGRATISLRELDAQGKSLGYFEQTVPAGQPDWRDYELMHRPSKQAAALRVYFYIAPTAASGSAWWDDVRLTASADPFPSNKSDNSLRVAPIATTTIIKTDNQNTPDTLWAWINAGRDAVGGHVTLQLAKTWSNGQVDSKPIWSLDASKVDREGPRPVQVPVVDLPQGRYRLALDFTNADGTMNVRWNRPVAVIPPFNAASPEPITRSDIGPNGLLRVNGKPFLSIYFYHNLLTPQVLGMLHKDYGVTTAQIWGGASIDKLVDNVDMAYQAGLYSWAVLFHPATFDAKTKTWKTEQLIEAVNRLKSHPGLIGWDLSDEPDGTGVSPEEVRRAADLVRKNDPNHVVMVNLCRETTLAKFGGISDIAAYDSYPFHARPLTVLHKWNQEIKASAPGKPLMSCLQTWGDIGRGMPTPAQLRAQTYFNICDGMAMFHYYSWTEGNHAFGFMNNDSELASCVKVLNYEMKQLQPFLFEGKPVKVAVSGSSELTSIAKQVGDAVEVIVVNPTADPVEQVRVALDRPISSAVSRFDNGRHPQIDGGAVVDRLPAYGVAVYQLKD